jgi:hypothetical protein
MGILLTKATHGVCDPKELRATTSCSNILCIGSGWTTLYCLQEDQDTKEDHKHWQVLEVDFLSIRHPAKSVSENHEEPKKKTRSTKAEVGSVTQVA